MLANNTAYKYETTYKVPFVITQCWTNGTVTLQCSEIKLGIIYAALIHINMIQTLKILAWKNMYDDVNIWSPVIYLCIVLNIVNKVYNRIYTETLTLIHMDRAREVFYDDVIFSTLVAPFSLDKGYINLHDFFQTKRELFSTRTLIWVQFKTVHYFFNQFSVYFNI